MEGLPGVAAANVTVTPIPPKRNSSGPSWITIVPAGSSARLARQSHPKVTLDTGGLSPEATALANRLARDIRRLSAEAVAAIAAVLDAEAARKK